MIQEKELHLQKLDKICYCQHLFQYQLLFFSYGDIICSVSQLRLKLLRPHELYMNIEQAIYFETAKWHRSDKLLIMINNRCKIILGVLWLQGWNKDPMIQFLCQKILLAQHTMCHQDYHKFPFTVIYHHCIGSSGLWSRQDLHNIAPSLDCRLKFNSFVTLFFWAPPLPPGPYIWKLLVTSSHLKWQFAEVKWGEVRLKNLT